ncbi:uncharacterized protein EI90DRAFT_2385695 [Cantharellus anzutake]|uniref:uncharacterized protein n=1 Tax=Cantharellus anzutake TaxID=1750568 RepID=UPI001902EB2F|nr:uncharacterized protein EI90DRAFT_2385695 [Cantharellus anzutake]KAF8323507.1 hypothetical protein EI90DRAFT_2385695 [Cantharellus anzutake]
MVRTLGRSLLTVAVLALLHAAFSTYEYLSQLKALDKLTVSRHLPSNIVIELYVALLTFILGATLNSPPLRGITWASEMSTRCTVKLHCNGITLKLAAPPYPNPSEQSTRWTRVWNSLL